MWNRILFGINFLAEGCRYLRRRRELNAFLSLKRVNVVYNELWFDRNNKEKAFPNQPHLDEKDLELRRLKARITELEEEREILKKTAAFFAK
ncbi:hypothetical protein [Legionella sp.]|uniref:hypothetical protein n=1 Tax=Legionella sp. TaxID=459 RepID=UPI00322079E1